MGNSKDKVKVEIWKDIPNYHYQVSNLGRVRNSKNNMIRRQSANNCGYYQVNLGWKRDSNGKIIEDANGIRTQYVPLVARLVAEAFIPNPNNLPEVNHIDENKTHNYVDNLEWINSADNVNHGTRTARQREYALNMTASHKQKLSIAAKNRGTNNSGPRMVELTDKDGNTKLFDNVREAARFLGVNFSRVHYNNNNGREVKGYTIHKLSDAEMLIQIQKNTK